MESFPLNDNGLPVEAFDADDSSEVELLKMKSVKLTPEELCIKDKINELFKDLNQYIQTNNYENDACMKTLCDDLSIVYNKIGGEHDNTYALSRHSTQGDEQSYNTSSPFIKPPKLKRYNHCAHIIKPLDEFFNNNTGENDDI